MLPGTSTVLYNLHKVNEQVEILCYIKMPNAFKSTKARDGFSRMTNWDFELFFKKRTGFFILGGGL